MRTHKLVALDVETTGTVRGYDRVIQIADVMHEVTTEDDGTNPIFKEVGEINTLVDPGAVIMAAEAVEAHGITPDKLASAPEFISLASNLNTRWSDAIVLGYNVNFDLRMLTEEFGQTGIDSPFNGDTLVIDPYRLWTKLSPRQLVDACKEFAVAPPTQAHDALEDVRSTTRLLAGMMQPLFTAELLKPNAWTLEDLASASQYERGSDSIDSESKLIRRGDDIIFTFGKHRGRTFAETPRSYLRWMMNADFSEEITNIVEDYLYG